jgi:Protein of unknown function (DUF3800)
LGHSGAWRSLSGVRLAGRNLARLVYLDESGLSRDEPYLVVASVIVHADNQLGPLEDCLRGIIDDHVPENLRDGFVLHAADLFSGNKKELPPEIWDQEIRWRILQEVLSIPKQLKIEVCAAYIIKKRFQANYASSSASKQRIAMHAAAIVECTVAVEKWMRECTTNEVAILFAENNDEVRKAAKATQILMKSENAKAKLPSMWFSSALPLVRIKEGINFVTKPESLALQLADACAWAFRKHRTKDPKASQFYATLETQVVKFSMTTVDAAALL